MLLVLGLGSLNILVFLVKSVVCDVLRERERETESYKTGEA